MRPQLNVAISAPATANVGEDYTATVTISQPATGKIDATEVLLDVQGSSNATFTFTDSIDAIAPGESKTVDVIVRGLSAGEVTLTAVAEAAQVSPGAAVNAKTLVGSAGPTTPVVTPPGSSASDVSGSGRFGGGALGAALLLMLGLGAGLRRQRN